MPGQFFFLQPVDVGQVFAEVGEEADGQEEAEDNGYTNELEGHNTAFAAKPVLGDALGM